MSLVDKKFTLLSGNDEIVIPLMSIGGKGVVSVVANILPKQTHNMVDSFLKGNTKKAADMQLKLLELINTLFIETNPIPVKTAMKLMGLIQANMRLPLVKMNKSNLNQLKTVLKKYSII
jgi:4-hydroxy-tetrahydrodipicolinate synthase